MSLTFISTMMCLNSSWWQHDINTRCLNRWVFFPQERQVYEIVAVFMNQICCCLVVYLPLSLMISSRRAKPLLNWLMSEQEGFDQCTMTASEVPKMLQSISNTKPWLVFPVSWQILCQNKMQLYDVWLFLWKINLPKTALCQFDLGLSNLNILM